MLFKTTCINVQYEHAVPPPPWYWKVGEGFPRENFGVVWALVASENIRNFRYDAYTLRSK